MILGGVPQRCALRDLVSTPPGRAVGRHCLAHTAGLESCEVSFRSRDHRDKALLELLVQLGGGGRGALVATPVVSSAHPVGPEAGRSLEWSSRADQSSAASPVSRTSLRYGPAVSRATAAREGSNGLPGYGCRDTAAESRPRPGFSLGGAPHGRRGEPGAERAPDVPRRPPPRQRATCPGFRRLRTRNLSQWRYSANFQPLLLRSSIAWLNTCTGFSSRMISRTTLLSPHVASTALPSPSKSTTPVPIGS